MTLLIDPPNAAGHGRLWSHLASDTSFDELHRFARALGIPERGFDRDHYDIPAERYHDVVAAGAVPVSSRELVARLHAAGIRRRKAGVLAPRPAGRHLVRAERLREGSRVAVVAASGPVAAERLDAGVEVLRSWGLDPVVMPHARGTDLSLPYLAAADAARAEDLAAAWCDPEVAAVLLARGGYGAQRIVDRLDWTALAEAGPKLLLGYSDATALHLAFGSRLGLSTVHGPVVAGLADTDPDSREHLRRLLLHPERALDLVTGCDALVPGDASGLLVGGNLTLLASGVGTPDAGSAANAIVVLEEIGEDAYRVDRLLTQLLRSGWFDGVRGVVVGALTGSGPVDVVRALLLDRLGPLGVPVLTGAPVGHEAANRAFPLGLPAVLDGARGSLTLEVPALL